MRGERALLAVRIETVETLATIGTTAICHVEGELDAASAADLREALATLTAFERVVLDFSEVPFIDSAGLACLIAGVRRVHASNGDVVLSSARRAVHRLLLTVGMERVLPITDTIAEAMAVLDAAPDTAADGLRDAPPRLQVQRLPA